MSDKIRLTFALEIDPSWLGNWLKNLVIENIHNPKVMELAGRIMQAIAASKKKES